MWHEGACACREDYFPGSSGAQKRRFNLTFKLTRRCLTIACGEDTTNLRIECGACDAQLKHRAATTSNIYATGYAHLSVPIACAGLQASAGKLNRSHHVHQFRPASLCAS
eukprot:TRINITY_DN4935_c0_g1_i1.p1 TRINITY_DN4935_c0_g1~~TRINITY_DN4935_c0_g1_i1.p1  ORF type:complete len:110 (-),score=7.08 TRINITY_DN4935_c0_g1_i1:127-456(-)